MQTPLTEYELNKSLPEFYPRIFRMIRTMTFGTGMDPEDLTQDSFLKAYNKRHLYNGKSSLYTWVYQIARNTVLDALRSYKIRRRIFWWEETDREPQDFQSAEDGDSTIAERERKRLLYKALAKLPEKDRLYITLRDLEGLSYQEISEMEQIAEGTVKSRLFHARRKLKQELIDIGMNPEESGESESKEEHHSNY
ncbi:RNA polymerase sigma factor [Balneolaceae bacterium ANBcel3]|nr:RNA polymerase sigma factor [Balneolaceae bacterium ANBcel3]